MALRDLVIANRSCRRFRQDKTVGRDLLEKLVDLARVSPSGGNRQPLKFFLENRPDWNDVIFPLLSWAGYLIDWQGPAEGEKPAAYIIILHDTSIRENPGCDHGIAAQSILLGAVEEGLRGCIIGSVDRERLGEKLRLDKKYRIMLVLALGFPAEEAVIEEVPDNGDIKYWRDESGRHHVPKRALENIIINGMD